VSDGKERQFIDEALRIDHGTLKRDGYFGYQATRTSSIKKSRVTEFIAQISAGRFAA
jgi:hypothetical protein